MHPQTLRIYEARGLNHPTLERHKPLSTPGGRGRLRRSRTHSELVMNLAGVERWVDSAGDGTHQEAHAAPPRRPIAWSAICQASGGADPPLVSASVGCPTEVTRIGAGAGESRGREDSDKRAKNARGGLSSGDRFHDQVPGALAARSVAAGRRRRKPASRKPPVHLLLRAARAGGLHRGALLKPWRRTVAGRSGQCERALDSFPCSPGTTPVSAAQMGGDGGAARARRRGRGMGDYNNLHRHL